MSDELRHDATQPGELHTMTLRELEEKIIAAGILMSRRQIMRHCESGTFEAKKLPATNNIDEWFIVPSSVERGIADIKTLQQHRARHVATRLDMTRTKSLLLSVQTRRVMTRHSQSRLTVKT